MIRLSTLVLSVMILVVACGSDETTSTATDSPAHEATPPPASVASSPEVIELQSSGSLRFKVVAGRVDNGWCAHLVDAADGASAWHPPDCEITTAAAAAESISYAIAGAPADPEVKVFYGLIGPGVSKVLIDVVSGSVTSSLQAGPAQRAELGELGSFSLFVRPGMGTPVRLRLLGADGSALRTIEL